MNFGMNDFFKILNFIVLCIGVSYLIFRYGILYIMSAIRIDKQKKEEEAKKHTDLVLECDLIKQLSHTQEVNYVSMQKQFEIWKHKEREDKDIHQAWLHRYQQELVKKRVLKIQNMQRQQIIQLQLPKILQEVSEQLREKFENNSMLQKKYNDALVAFMREKTI